MKKLVLALALLATTASVAEARRIGRYTVEVANRTGYDITNVFARNVRRDLGDVLPGTIAPGSSAYVDFSNDGEDCVFRIKAMTSDGRSTGEVVKNICELGTWTITENGELND